MSEQTIQSHDFKVADVFKEFYVVPDYQREYVWETDEVEQLLADINGELAGCDPAKGNRPFSQKRSVYPQSQLLLTRAVAERPKIGANTKIDAAVAKIDPFDKWNEANVTTRQDMIRGLARAIWNVPATAGG